MKNGCWQQGKFGEKSTMSAQGKALEISTQGTDIKDACKYSEPTTQGCWYDSVVEKSSKYWKKWRHILKSYNWSDRIIEKTGMEHELGVKNDESQNPENILKYSQSHW
jgi:hypothetical protein